MQPWSRMKVSASRSSSIVVTPSWTDAARWARHSPRMRPLTRIFSTSSGRLSRNASTRLRISVRPGGDRVGADAEDGEDRVGHLLDRGVAVDVLEVGAAVLVVADHRRRLRLVLAHPVDEGLGGVVGPVLELAAVDDALLEHALGDVEEEDDA